MSIYTTAAQCLQAGVSVIPVSGKKPSIAWGAYQHRRATIGELSTWAADGLLETGFGIVCGAVSGNLAVIDLDGDEACATFARAFPHLLGGYTVQSGSGHGLHLYFRCGVLPPTTRTTGYELRANGCYVVGAPSLHPSGKQYRILDGGYAYRVPDLAEVVTWIKSRMKANNGGVMPAPRALAAPEMRSRWAAAALAGELASVRAASQGRRNNALYIAALKLGSLVAADQLRQADVEAALCDAAAGLAADEGADTVANTIASGMRIGMASPRPLERSK